MSADTTVAARWRTRTASVELEAALPDGAAGTGMNCWRRVERSPRGRRAMTAPAGSGCLPMTRGRRPGGSAAAVWGMRPSVSFTTLLHRAAGYHVLHRAVSGTVVLRDLELEVAMDTAVTVFIPAFLRYDHDRYRRVADCRTAGVPGVAGEMLQFLRTGSNTRPALATVARAPLGNQGWAAPQDS